MVKKRGGCRPSAGRPTALGQGQTTTIRIPLKYKEQILNYVKCLSERERVDDVPFGPPPEEFNYRCSRCRHEMQLNEAVIDVQIGMAELDGTCIKGFMPILGCPNCNQETME